MWVLIEEADIRINPYKRFLFAPVPNWLAVRTEISQGAKLCYAVLMMRAGRDGSCWPSTNTLGEDLGVTGRQVKTYLKNLRECALIETEKRGMNESNNYYFLDHEWMNIEGGTSPRKEESITTERMNPSLALEKATSPYLDSSEKTQVKDTTVKVAPSPKKRKEPPNPNVRTFIDWWCTRHQKVLGIKYMVIGGRDGGLVKRLLAQVDLPTLQENAERLLSTKDAWLIKRGRTIPTLLGEWNKLAAEDVVAQDRPSLPVWGEQ